jgi:hypothetical protein
MGKNDSPAITDVELSSGERIGVMEFGDNPGAVMRADAS